MLPVSVFGQWGNRTLTDQSQFLSTMIPLASDPQVQAAVADVLTEAIVEQVDTEQAVGGLIGNLLPNSPFADTLTSPITAGVNALIGQLVANLIASDIFIDVWTEVNIAAQDSLIAILEGRDEGPIQTANGAIVLDISSLLIAVQERLVAQGVGFAANVVIEPGRRTIVLAEPAGLAQIQFIYRFANPILGWAVALLALGFAIAILLARRRPRMVVATGVVVAVWGGVLAVLLNSGEETFVNRLAGTPLGPAADRFWTYFFTNLETGLRTLITAGVLLIIAGWLSGQSRPARAIRNRICDAADRIRVFLPVNGAWTEQQMQWARIIVLAIGVAIFIATDALGISNLLWATLISSLLLFVVQVIGGQPRAAHQASSASFA